ncbi:MAG: nucleotidyltransferase domain-containing protein [Nitrospirae bacterium]|nr:nucleotidyltransferase domain-containing protein [Nitrospirota bacterium]
MIKIDKYKKHWNEMALNNEKRIEKLRQKALKDAENLKEILVNEFYVEKVVLFGSIMKKGQFDEYSDIDLAVSGLSKNMYFAALGRLIMESEFNVDLKPIEDVSDLFKLRIAGGKVLYEKRKDSRSGI